MVWVELLDVCTEVLHPSSHSVVVAVGRAGKVAVRVGTAPGFVGQLPGHDRRGGFVSIDKHLEVFLVGIDNLRYMVKVIMVFSAEVDCVHVHSAVVCPLY